MADNRDRPNILIVMTEHQQGATVAPDSLCRMPNVRERIAAEGMRFDRGYTPCALCAPARASFFSGRYPTGHGMYNNYQSVPVINADLFPGVRLFSEVLKEADYNLSYVGKWHVSGVRDPTDFGWENPLGDEQQWMIYAPDLEERQRLWEELRAGRYRSPLADVPGGVWADWPGWPKFSLYGTRPGTLEDMWDYQRTQAAIGEIRRLASQPEPWVLYVGLTEIHDPYFPVEPYASMYDARDVPLPGNYHDTMEDKPGVYRRMRQQLWSQFTEEQVREAIAAYWGLCTMTDDLMGMMLDTLEEAGVAEDTLVLFCSDHGDQVGGHGLFMKGIHPFEESYRVPISVRWPRVIEPGSICSEFVTLCDFAPTFCELVGAEPLEGTAGRSLLPLFEGTVPNDWPQTFFGQFCGTEYFYTQRIVSDKRYKYVFNAFDFDELYDLESDPHEMVNLDRNPEYEGVKRRLVGEMWEWVERSQDIINHPYPTVELVPYGPIGWEK
jgi:arylsulfatase A-like enzyme